MSTESNVESLLKAILTGDEEYIVVPQSRVEELLLAIYKNGGGGGGGGTAGIKYLGVIDDYKNLSTTAKRGDYYLAGTADKYKNIHVGDMLIAQKDNPSATIDNSNYRLLHTELDTDTTYTITQDSKDAHIFYFKASTEIGTGTKITIPDNDTKTTAASDEKSATKLYLVGTMTQDATGVKTYANAKVYIGTDNCLYSNGEKVALQSDVDKKLNKTAVLSDFSSAELTNKVPSAQLVLDSFTKKVTTEAVANNTRIITVPENVDCFAGIGMIGGRTHKCKNFYDCLKTEPYSAGKETVTTTENSVRVVMSKAGTYAASKFVYSFTVGKSYTLSADVTIASGTARLAVRTADNTVKAGTNPITANGHYTTTFTATSDMSFVSLFATWDSVITGDVTYSNIMLVEGNAEIPYEPYHAELWNTPVTSVVSQSKNLFDGKPIALLNVKENGFNKWINTYVDTRTSITLNGRLYANNTPYGTSLVVNTSTDGRKYFLFTKTSDFDAIAIGHSGATADLKIRVDLSNLTNGKSYCVSALFEGVANVVGGFTIKDVLLEESETATEYTPYNKTTISLDTIVNNLPDYGKSAGEVYNYIDFEEGVYHHKVKSVDLSTLTWKNNTSWFGSSLDDCKPQPSIVTIGNIVCSIYNNVKWSDIGNSGYDKSIGVTYDSSKAIGITDTSVTSIDALLNKLKGEIFVYELATEEIYPLSDILSPIHVEPNGTLEFVNEHNLDVPSKTIYKKSV